MSPLNGLIGRDVKCHLTPKRVRMCVRGSNELETSAQLKSLLISPGK